MADPERRDNTVLQAVLDLTKQVSAIQTELAVNTTETKNIVSRLDKLNGSVAKHDTAISLNEQAIALLTQTITALSRAEQSSADAKSNWLDWLLKGLVVMGLLLFYTLLTHAGVVQDFLRNIN
jgi:hypothetical protein